MVEGREISMDMFENGSKEEKIKEAILKIDKKFEVETLNLEGKSLPDEMDIVINEGIEAEEFLEKVAPDTLAEIYKNQQKKLDELIKQSEAEIKQQTNKCGIVKKIKESFALAGGIFAIIGVLFTFVVFGGSIAETANNQEAGKIYQGWLDSEDAIVLVEQLSNEYLEQYKVGEITYEQYREKMNGIGNTEALHQHVQLPAAEKYLSAAKEARTVEKVSGVGALSAAALSVTAEAARGVAYMVEKGKKKKRSKAYDYTDRLWDAKDAVDLSLEQLGKN